MRNQNMLLVEGAGLKLGAIGDLNGAALIGSRVNMKHGSKIAFVVMLASAVGGDVILGVKQHNADVGGTSKALQISKVYTKIDTETAFTKTEFTAADTKDLTALFAGKGGIVVVEVDAGEMDVNGAFSNLSLEIASAASSRHVTVLNVLNNFVTPAYEIDL